MELKYLSQDVIDDLKINMSAYKNHYCDGCNDWFLSHFEQKNALRTSRITVEEIEFNYDEDYYISDKANVISVYTALSHLTPAQAADERIWSALLHTDAWEFIHYRRKKEASSEDETILKSLYFYNRGTKRSCYVNGLAKYWWCGYMIYDPDSRDHFSALDVLCNTPYFSSLVMLLSSCNFNG